jgi:hypothetical protein
MAILAVRRVKIMLKHPLQIGTTRLSPGTLHSLTLTEEGVFIDSQAGIFCITGLGLSHLVRDLIHQQCDKITAGLQTGNSILDWKADTVESARRIRDQGSVHPFQCPVPAGWILFENEQRWSFFPVSTLIAIGYRTQRVGFLYGDKLVVVTSDQAREIFESFPTKSESAHYTIYDPDDHFDMEPVTRYKVESIRIREVGTLDGMAAFREKKVFKELDSSHAPKRRGMER